jgi:ankyrin repeat protein
MDGRKHTTLSEAACQGHTHIVTYLLEQGANPNALSDTDRSPLWRAAFNNHVEVVRLLLEAGSDPDIRDKVSGESAFDIAQSDELRNLISSWDRSKTSMLMEARSRAIAMKLEERIRTTAEREQFAKMQLSKDLVSKAESGDIIGIKEILTMVAEEAEKTSTRPRVTAECRNTSGQSLLSIAAQRDDVDLATFLLTHWKECDKDRWDLAEGEISLEAKVFKTSPNTRDLKGWTCVCIAVFHSSLKVLQLLLEHGGDPNIRSSYNKNAWDLAKDEMDAAEHVIKSRAELRKVIQDYDTSNKSGSQIFGTGKVPIGPSDLYKDLGPDGSALVMNIEMNNSLDIGVSEGNKKVGGGKGKIMTKKTNVNKKK